MAILSVGKDILSYCSKCKLSLSHIIVSMLDSKTISKVKCNTCQSMHRFKDPTLGGKSISVTKRAPTATNVRPKANKYSTARELWTEQYAKSSSVTSPYTIRQKFSKGDTIDHKLFGIGFVQEVHDDKIEVLFQDDIKTLVHAK